MFINDRYIFRRAESQNAKLLAIYQERSMLRFLARNNVEAAEIWQVQERGSKLFHGIVGIKDASVENEVELHLGGDFLKERLAAGFILFLEYLFSTKNCEKIWMITELSDPEYHKSIASMGFSLEINEKVGSASVWLYSLTRKKDSFVANKRRKPSKVAPIKLA